MRKKTAPALTPLSTVQFLIFMQQVGKRDRKEKRFLVKQKANLQLRQFSLGLLLLLGKMSWKISCMYNSHTLTHTYIRTDMQIHISVVYLLLWIDAHIHGEQQDI